MPTGAVRSQTYVVQFFALLRHSLAQLVRAPSHSQRKEAARQLARHTLLLTAILGASIIVLMLFLDVPEIALMPARGTPGLWPVRILTDFGKDEYVLWLLAAILLVIVFTSPALAATARARWLHFGTRVQYLFLAVLVPVLAAEAIKWAAGRGRPFVGGKANAFNFAPFTGTEAYFSFPSAHAVTGFALAFAVGALWPRARPGMLLYALFIAASRLVLLAHHPSDVIAGALVGVLGAMAVRYWFAARQLCFAIHSDGKIVPDAYFSH
jgi:membrane-associated phospholipid phosphatase